MDLHQLRCFLAVAEELHFGRAAARLHISQPPLSQHIRNLESVLGVRLFERTNRRVALTEAGRVLQAHARSLVNQASLAAHAAKRAARGEEGHLAIGFLHASAYTILPRIVGRYRREFPGVDLRLEEASTSEQLAALRDGRLDIGFIWLPVSQCDIATRLVSSEPFCLAAPSSRRIAAGDAPPDLREVEAQEFIMFPEQPGAVGLGAVVRRILAASGCTPRQVQVANTIHTALGLVGAGIGLALVPRSAERLRMDGVVLHPLAGDHEEAQMGLAWRASGRGVSRVRDRFLETAAEPQ